MTNVIGIRFRRAGKVYYFDPGELEINTGDRVVVQTGRGTEVGHVVIGPRLVSGNDIQEPLKVVLRQATPEDIEKATELENKAEAVLIECGKQVAELGLAMKLLAADYNLDGNRLTIMFSAEERVDFRELVKRLSGQFKVRVELRQVGSRDEAKIVGGYGKCGQHLCCASFLSEFQPVSIKMAKEQQLPLNPAKISGTCGRLMCCLAYENDLYRETRAKMPRLGQKVNTPSGEAKVTGLNPLKYLVRVALESGGEIELPVSEVTKV